MSLPLSANPRAQPRRAGFTMVELLVSMSILSMVMVLLLLVTQGMQRNWKWQTGRAKIYQNSRLVFDVIERDLRAMTVSQVPGQKIGWHNWLNNGQTDNGRMVVTFVASVEPSAAATERLCEISYRLTTQRSDSDCYRLQRQCIGNDDTTYWNFLDEPANWWDNTGAPETTWETLVEGVQLFYPYLTYADTMSSMPTAPQNLSADTPILQVAVNLSLFDDSYTNRFGQMNDTSLERLRTYTKRSFTKIFYLGTTP